MLHCTDNTKLVIMYTMIFCIAEFVSSLVCQIYCDIYHIPQVLMTASEQKSFCLWPECLHCLLHESDKVSTINNHLQFWLLLNVHHSHRMIQWHSTQLWKGTWIQNTKSETVTVVFDHIIHTHFSENSVVKNMGAWFTQTFTEIVQHGK